ncbi:MAG: arsenate reductase (glutaredoxin) [Paracoccus sp. (in: a-proteobacteria)]|nr:arsenate reductase (glutaredoxin) [Paracoccus sp. (in: a-proteobacteria)]
MSVTIYHNPRCSTSRKVLEMIRERGETPEVIDYLKAPPSRDDLRRLARDSGLGLRGLLRQKGTPYDDLGLADQGKSDEQLLDAIEAHPILLNRPVVVTAKGTRLTRPVELLDEILPARG